MPTPSFYDWVAAVRHNPYGTRIPWLERHSEQDLAAIPASVLALHLPSAGGSGPGHLVIAPDGDAAFITENGTCWEIGHLETAIKDAHESDDGRFQLFLARPTSLHVTVEPASAPSIKAILGVPSVHAPQTTSGDIVSLFSQKSTSGSPELAFPAGQEPPQGVPIGEYLARQALSMTPDSGIPREDLMSYSDAGYANALGIPESDLIIAWGPALIQTPEDSSHREGTVVVTRNTMLAYWQPGRTSMIHTFQGNHSAVTAAQPTGEYAMMLEWEIAEYANNQGKFMVGEAAVMLGAQMGRDGHANRRALTWFSTLATIVDGGGGGYDGPTPPPSAGGLGSRGTKL
jgi:hypothetical protein